MLEDAKSRQSLAYDPNASEKIQGIEREQEEKLIDEMKNWEQRAADFIDLYVGTDQRDQFRKCEPSIDDGFNRVKKHFSRLIRLAPPGKPPQPVLSYWTLSDAIISRVDKLIKISEQLK